MLDVRISARILFVSDVYMDKTIELIETKPKKKRIVTETKHWNEHISILELSEDKQHEWLHKLREDTAQICYLKNQIKQKINSYKYQDLKKNKYNPDTFVTLPFVLDLLTKSDLCCFYCKHSVLLWYDFSREPKQWSLERIDNAFGHNCDNVEIACLSCNLKRRCMYHERYRFTKQLIIVKLDKQT